MHACVNVFKKVHRPLWGKRHQSLPAFQPVQAFHSANTFKLESHAETTCTAASLCAAITSCSIKVLQQVLLITKSLTVAAEHSQMDVLGSLERKVIAAVCKYCCAFLVTPYAENDHLIIRNMMVCLGAVGQC